MNEPVFEIYERRSRFTEELYEDIAPAPSPWLVKGILPAVGLAYIAGPSRSGKSFVAVDWCLRIASGLKVMDKRTSSGSVIYFAAEDASGIRLRVDAWKRDMGMQAAAFSLMPENPFLQDPDDFGDVQATVQAISERRIHQGQPLKLVVFDTLAQSAPGIEENASTDLGPILSRLAQMAVQMQCLVVLIAHTGKDEARGVRGWSGQLGNSDAIVMVDRKEVDGTAHRTLLLDKIKNGPDGAKWDFSLKIINMGLDEDGDAVTSCVPVYEGAAAGTRTGTPGQNQRDKFVLRALRMCEDAGLTVRVPATEGVPAGTLGVMRERLKEKLIDEGYGGEDDNPDSLKRRINRDILRLIEREAIRANPEMVWFRTDR